MPLDPVELTKQIKAASDIVAVVGGYFALKPAGAIFKCLCPFHNDSRPSLDIDPRRQRYRCWSCGAHGDVIAFVQHVEKVGFKEARAILATRAGIKLDEAPTPQDQARSLMLDVVRWAQDRYRNCLLEDPAAEAARKYLGERRISGATVRQFGLGFAPLDGDWIAKLAHADGVPEAVLVEVGLVAPRAEGRGYYDRFRDRVMFPIRDVQGRPIAFGGRIVPESPLASRAPKYYNSAETPLFSKSDILYGLDLARQAGAAAGYLAVVEGYTDAMMAHQCGVSNVVATMGTALNARHVAQIRRYVPKVVLVYDADAGGNTGVDRALEIFVGQDVDLAVAALPDGLDPCDLLVRPEGTETFKRVLSTAVDALDFKLNRLLARDAAPSVEATRRIIDDILGIMATAPDRPSQSSQVKQELIVTRLAHRLGLRQETVWARFGERKAERRQRNQQQAARAGPAPAGVPPHADGVPANEPATKGGRGATIERQLVELLLAEPLLVSVARHAIDPAELAHTGLRRLLAEMYSLDAAGLTADVDELRERLKDRPDLADASLRLQEVGQFMQDREQWLGRIAKRFAELKSEAEQRAVRAQMSAASADPDAAVELLRRLQATGKAAV